MRIALYLRVSTRDKQDITKQRDYLLNYVRNRPEWEVYHIFGDIGVSGQKSHRPELDDMLNQIDQWDAVLVYKMDRIGRSLKHLVQLMELFKTKGKQFISATESIDTTNPQGLLFFHLLAAFAQFEREIIRQRVSDGLAAARARGHKPGRKKGQKDKKPRRRAGYFQYWEKKKHDMKMNQAPKSELEKQLRDANRMAHLESLDRSKKVIVEKPVSFIKDGGSSKSPDYETKDVEE